MNSKVALIIPVYNEAQSIERLITTIKEQSLLPAEVILVDGGSTDGTVKIAKELITGNPAFRIIEVERAMPGKGRNIGVENTACNWIAFTDAGIKLDKYWLENLVKKSEQEPSADIIYGNFSPQINSFFEKCATISYVPPLLPDKIRTKSIASCLLKKEVWEKVGGFPDWRAAEDLEFMDKAEDLGCKSTEGPEGIIYWELRPDIKSTFKKFELYSIYNVWAGRQANWHYGVARQYSLIIIFLLLAFFHNWLWIFMLPLWILARAGKRIWSHKYEFGAKLLLNPLVVLMVIAITLVIDAATFSGWIKALIRKEGSRNFSPR